MTEQIVFTPQDIATMVLWICGAICSLSAAAGVIAKVVERMKKPNKTQDERLDEQEKRMDAMDEKFKEYDRFFAKDKTRIESIEEGNRVTQKALLALLAHAINGNNEKELRDAESSLREYLVRR